MQAYEGMSQGDISKTLQNQILKQNNLLRILQEEPEHVSYQSGYDTKLGLGQRQLGRSVESVDSKFFEDNKKWILDEVQKYLEGAEVKE